MKTSEFLFSPGRLPRVGRVAVSLAISQVPWDCTTPEGLRSYREVCGYTPPPPSSAPVLIISGINSASLPSWPNQLLPGMAEYRYVSASCNSASGRIQTLPRILSRNSFPISCALIMSNRRKLIIINTLFQLFLDICAPSHSESQDFQIVLRSED